MRVKRVGESISVAVCLVSFDVVGVGGSVCSERQLL